MVNNIGGSMNKKQYILSLLKTKPAKALWEVSHGCFLNRNLRDELEGLRDYRYSIRGKTDKLEEKLRYYSNNGAWSREYLRKQSKRLFEAKTPTSDFLGEWISVEIETIFYDESSYNSFLSKIRSFRNYVTIKEDSSLECDGSCDLDEDGNHTCITKEIVVSFRLSDTSALNAICDNLNGLAFVNRSCGLHVHFDMRHKTRAQVRLLGQKIANCVPALKLMLPESRRNNYYCSKDINAFKRGNKYAFVNLRAFTKYKTLEIRGHSGTIDFHKIINWCLILKNIMNHRGKLYANTIEDLGGILNLPQYQYALARRDKFNPLPKGISGPIEEANNIDVASEAA